jgi:hypothetical protein
MRTLVVLAVLLSFPAHALSDAQRRCTRAKVRAATEYVRAYYDCYADAADGRHQGIDRQGRDEEVGKARVDRRPVRPRIGAREHTRRPSRHKGWPAPGDRSPGH